MDIAGQLIGLYLLGPGSHKTLGYSRRGAQLFFFCRNVRGVERQN